MNVSMSSLVGEYIAFEYEKDEKCYNSHYVQQVLDYGMPLKTIYVDKNNKVIIGDDVINSLVNFMKSSFYQDMNIVDKRYFDNQCLLVHTFHKDVDVEKVKASYALMCSTQ